MVKSTWRRTMWVGLLFLGLSAPALAQDDNPFDSDDDDFEFDLGEETPDEDGDEEDAEDEPATEPAAPVPDDELEEPDDEALDFEDPLDGDEDLLGDDPGEQVPEGGDTAAIYRMTIEEGRRLDTDEELQLWDTYLEKYPNTSFRQQIDIRRNELEAKLYKLSVGNDTEVVDAQDEAFSFAHGVLLENANPRDRVLVLLEWGLPDYASLALDVEKEIVPRLSIHGGFRRRFTGPSIEAGLRYALVRSPRTNTLVTGMLDVRANTGPAFVAVRPMFAAGKRFGKVDVQLQAGLELAPREGLDTRIIGGVNASYRASDAVGLFAETALYMHTLSGQAGPYRFNQFVFGMNFLPRQKAERPEDLEISVAATLPYTSAYWQYHFGSIVGQAVIAF
jgi:hypothetical protein